MGTQTLEHKVLGQRTFADIVTELKRWDSLAELQARRAGTPLNGAEMQESEQGKMQDGFYYASDVAAYSIQDGNYILELYDLNSEVDFPNKSEFVKTLMTSGNYFLKLPDLEDKARTINLSDEKFNEFVHSYSEDKARTIKRSLSEEEVANILGTDTAGCPQRSIALDVTKRNLTGDPVDRPYITFDISDVIKGKNHFEETYGTEAAKLFTAVHGEEVYSQEGVKGRFRVNEEPDEIEAEKLFTAMLERGIYIPEGIEGGFRGNSITTRIYFLNQKVTINGLAGREEGTKSLRGAFLDNIDSDSYVSLDKQFAIDFAHVSGVVKKSGKTSNAPQAIDYKNIATTLGRGDFDPKMLAEALQKKGAKNIALTTLYSQK